MSDADRTRGIVRLASRHSVGETIDRLERLVRDKGLIVFARIDFSGDAARAGLAMQAEQMLTFGNPKAGTALLQVQPEAGLDLPLKALAFEGPDGRTLLVANAPEYVIERHGLPPQLAATLAAAAPLLEAAADAP